MRQSKNCRQFYGLEIGFRILLGISIEELLTHADDHVVKMRHGFEFIDDLPHIAYLKIRDDGPDIGSSVEVLEHEIAFIFQHQGVSHDDVHGGWVHPRSAVFALHWA